MSRKACAYVLTKSKKEKRAAVSVKTIQGFKDEVGLKRGLDGDIGFSMQPVPGFQEVGFVLYVKFLASSMILINLTSGIFHLKNYIKAHQLLKIND